MELNENCGIFGIWGDREAPTIVFLGLYSLQHRGQESAGIVATDGEHFFTQKGIGLVFEAIDQQKLTSIKGRAAIGHVRYSTTGKTLYRNIQPLVVEGSKGLLAVAHNGNLVNSISLRNSLVQEGAIFQSTTDTEIILHLLAREKKNLIDALRVSLSKLKGAYSFVFLTPSAMIVSRDPYGFRPLVLGRRRNGAYVASSETVPFSLLDVEFLREVEPGETLIINDGGIHQAFKIPSKRKAFCIFEFIYFARPDSFMFGNNVYEVRKCFGERLAEEAPVKADYVIPVPDSGLWAAIGYSQKSGIPMEFGLIRNHYVGRTFIQPTSSERAFSVRLKLNPVPEVLSGKKIVLIDDSIVRGTTSRKIISVLRKAGAEEVHLRISSPPVKWPCFYGIDTPTRAELIAAQKSVEQIRNYLQVDSLHYLSKDGMLSCVTNPQNFCTACFTGDYPEPLYDAEFAKMRIKEREEK